MSEPSGEESVYQGLVDWRIGGGKKPFPKDFFDQSCPRIPGKTVYLLGAGFSAPLGLPVMSSFLSDGLSLLKKYMWGSNKDGGCRESRRGGNDDVETVYLDKLEDGFLTEVLEVNRRYLHLFASMGVKEPSLEELFSVVDLFSGDSDDRKTLMKFVQAVVLAARKRHEDRMQWVRDHKEADPTCVPTVGQIYFHNQGRSGKAGKMVLEPRSEVCAYEAFLSHLFSQKSGIVADSSMKCFCPDYAGPAIVSLNYDTVLEGKAQRFIDKKEGQINPALKFFYGTGVLDGDCDGDYGNVISPGPAEETANTVALLKLHGSLNWRWLNESETDVESLGDRSKVRLVEDGAPDPDCLIYPTWQRDPPNKTVFEKLLREARIHLRLASRIVVIGYSLPATDRYLTYLLADAASTEELPEIEICNVGKKSYWRKRASKVFGPRIPERKIEISSGFLEHVMSRKDPQALEP